MRDKCGRFAKGNPGGGRRKGDHNKASIAVESLLDGQLEELTQKAIQRALEGDVAALRLCLERIAPPRKDAPIVFDTPKVEKPEDAVKAAAAVVQAVAEGELSQSEGA